MHNTDTPMGSLTPNVKLIYERVGDTVYARIEGETERTVVGYDYKRDPLDHRNYMSDPKESQLWHDIRQAAVDDKELAYALERVKILYYLSKQKSEQVQYHPV
jgi:hypothetical protein